MNSQTLRKLEKSAESIAKKAGALILRVAQSNFEMREKAPFDLVTTADLESNKLIYQELMKAWPDSFVLAEEDGSSVSAVLKKARDVEILWIVDPLDGTTNFSKRVPHYAVSIAAYNLSRGEVLAGCIYDPSRKECFTAAKGLGAKRNGSAIHVSAVDAFHNALGATGFSYSKRKPPDNNLVEFAPFVESCLGIRRFGAAALDLAWVACGRYDFYWEPGLKPWDVAAGMLIVNEAGGVVSSFMGETSKPFDANIIAANPKLHNKVLSQIQSSRKKAGLVS